MHWSWSHHTLVVPPLPPRPLPYRHALSPTTTPIPLPSRPLHYRHAFSTATTPSLSVIIFRPSLYLFFHSLVFQTLSWSFYLSATVPSVCALISTIFTVYPSICSIHLSICHSAILLCRRSIPLCHIFIYANRMFVHKSLVPPHGPGSTCVASATHLYHKLVSFISLFFLY